MNHLDRVMIAGMSGLGGDRGQTRITVLGRMRPPLRSIKHSRLGLLSSARNTPLAQLVVGALMLCHGVFGSLHLCPTPHVATNHVHEHHSSTQTGAATHNDYPLCHVGHAAEYFAVLLAGFLALILGLVLKKASLSSKLSTPLIVERRLHPVGLHLSRGPTLPLLQVLRL